MGEGRARAPRIDVHAYFLPDDYRRAALAAGHDRPDGMPALPEWSVARRIADQASNLDLDPPLTRDEVFGTLRALHYDLAGSPMPSLARVLLDIADPGRLHYGSDWPFTPHENVVKLADEIDAASLFDGETRRRVLVDNALELFPRLRR